ncbi:MAG: hypothetical protein HDT33_02250 [Clostridiales bacterium]|nr:hypothetical protein [Clostridiales bacterium]
MLFCRGCAESTKNECFFARIVHIRDKRGQPLDKADRERCRRDRELVDFKRKCTDVEDALMKQWGGG